ncbi:MAG: hypothetical protein KJ070_24650 [Verrucomicrobia bacterium]|nr:hypothetical protein [Verrucomicrobiota bacterium]
MTLKPERLSERAIRWWSEANAHSRHLFTAVALSVATILAVVHYTFGDWVVYSEVALWRERAFWAAIPSVVAVPLAHWLAWTLVSLGRLRPASVILVAAAVLCLGGFGVVSHVAELESGWLGLSMFRWLLGLVDVLVAGVVVGRKPDAGTKLVEVFSPSARQTETTAYPARSLPASRRCLSGKLGAAAHGDSSRGSSDGGE